MADDATYSLRLLGPFDLRAPDGRSVAISSKKGRALLALLATAETGERARAWLQAQLWGNRPAAQAQTSLRQELLSLGAVLNRAGRAPLLLAERTRVRLLLDRVRVDVRDIEAGKARQFPFITEAGEFLEGLDLADADAFEDWLRDQRQLIGAILAQRRRASTAGRAGEHAPATAAEPAADGVRSPERPSSGPARPGIAVLSFATPGTDADADLADGIAEEIATSLARCSTLRIVAALDRRSCSAARDSAAAFGAPGVRYLLEGSVRRRDGRVRIAVRLVDGRAGELLWAETFTDVPGDVFALQDRLAATVAPMVESTIDMAELRRALLPGAGQLDAYQLWWRANALFRTWERGATLDAIGLAERVIDLQPDNAWAAALASICHSAAFLGRWTACPEETRRAALAWYDRAMRHGGDDPFVLGHAAAALVGVGGDAAVANRLIARALALHPDAPVTLFWGGWVDLAIGNAERARDRFERSLRLSPRSALRASALTGIGLALLALDRCAEAVPHLGEAVQRLPRHPFTLAGLCVALVDQGELTSARSYAERLDAAGGPDAILAILGQERHRARIEAGLAAARAAAIAPPGLALRAIAAPAE